MKTYTLNEVSKKINVPPGKMRQWEKEYRDQIDIPRSKQGARIYTDHIIRLFNEIKEMYGKKMNKEEIREELKKRANPTSMTPAIIDEPTLDVSMETGSTIPISLEETAITKADLFFEAMDTYKQGFLNEVKAEISSAVRKEVLEEVKREIKNGTFTTVKSLSDSIYKATATTKAEIEELSGKMDKNTEQTADSLKYLSNSITNVSIETAEEIFNLSKQISETTEDLAQYVDATNNEIYSLTEAITKDHQYFIEEREHLRNEIKQREIAFQTMLTSFRDAAATKEKKWWKFWA